MKLKLYPHSVSDVITNSSTECFCQIQAINESTAYAIADYLNHICDGKYTFEVDESYDENEPSTTISLVVSQGAFYEAGEDLPDLVATLLRRELSNKFNSDAYSVETEGLTW